MDKIFFNFNLKFYLRYVRFFIFVIIILAFANNVFAKLPVRYSKNSDVTYTDKIFHLKHGSVKVSATRPLKPMHPFSLVFTFKKADVLKLEYSTNMSMYMGKFEYEPIEIASNQYHVELILPKCMSKSSLWYGKLDITYKSGIKERLFFFYNLTNG